MTVHLVATGPGDPTLLTLQVEELLRAADAVAHEPAVSPDILTLIGQDAKIVEVEEDDHRALGALAAAHRSVVRVSTGDRLALQAGGAEAVALRAAGVEVIVVPVVLAAFALPARQGIPVMTRDLAPVLTVVVGRAAEPGRSHERALERALERARPDTTLVTEPDPGVPTIGVDGAVTALDLGNPGPGART